ncbi:hypothetical protein CTM93_20045 [Photobacterium phosphoreum]|uniref:glycosyltransferase family 25 protein n=1 Tax=Photobacterium phosphoreum TaxID=659 RepID=UPI0007F90FE8|nr:glycosyltransferase family 25 protein [Photobacterium phosphoreum]OBU32394.1 hypothetical protein AYY24_19245 [Photobacterium phosphoreum]PSU74889.1 hypothetical protein CTM93_20045 [Photobacterium phosphoreum]PSW33272.1 hypothetical protein CTM87_19315 [Photobacterium phosphoreum]
MSIDFYIISLKKDVERRKEITCQLNKLNIKSNIIDAVNGKELSAINYFNNMKCCNSKFRGRRFLTPSELGCYLSHKKALSEFIKTDKDILVVLEDDVSLVNKNIFYDIKLAEEFILNNNSVFVLGGQDGLKSFKRVILKKDINTNFFKKVSRLSTRFIYRTCSYMINRTVALEILNLMDKYSFFIDDWNLIVNKTDAKNIYYAYWFSHPVDISNSTIEIERRLI